MLKYTHIAVSNITIDMLDGVYRFDVTLACKSALQKEGVEYIMGSYHGTFEDTLEELKKVIVDYIEAHTATYDEIAEEAMKNAPSDKHRDYIAKVYEAHRQQSDNVHIIDTSKLPNQLETLETLQDALETTSIEPCTCGAYARVEELKVDRHLPRCEQNDEYTKWFNLIKPEADRQGKTVSEVYNEYREERAKCS